jgi:threonine dehydrogenase-like Zn-dependent dehydrogenase
MRAVICPDLRWLPTPGSSAAYGYNFEGGLQQDLCLDERVFMGPEGSALLPIDPGLPSAWAALAEPWSCIEHSYSLVERNSLLPGGRRLVVGRAPLLPAVAAELAAQPPGEARYAGNDAEFGGPYDDVIVVGADPDVIERALGCLAHGGHLWLLTAGARVPRSVRLRPAAFHYEGHRLIGTTGTSLRQAAAAVSRPYPTGRINLVGATGAMGQLHLAHLLSLGAVRSVHVGGRSPERLALLQSRLGLGTFPVHTYLVGDGIGSGFDGIVLLAPDTSLVQRALHAVVDHGWVDLFAGCARDDTIEIDLEDYVARGLYLRGTSGSTTRDIAAVLHRLATGSLDPGPVLSAESGMAGALEALLGVGRHHMLGKTVVYPGCSDLGLRPLPFGVQTRASVLEHERALGLPHRGPQ